jgi:hypothetical protein
MGCHRRAVYDTIARIPSASRTRTIKKHLDTSPNAERRLLEAATKARKLLECKKRKGGGHNPTDGIRKPRPAELCGIKTDMAIGSAELPLPKPIGFPASEVHEPFKTLQSCGYGDRQVSKAYQS